MNRVVGIVKGADPERWERKENVKNVWARASKRRRKKR